MDDGLCFEILDIVSNCCALDCFLAIISKVLLSALVLDGTAFSVRAAAKKNPELAQLYPAHAGG